MITRFPTRPRRRVPRVGRVALVLAFGVGAPGWASIVPVAAQAPDVSDAMELALEQLTSEYPLWLFALRRELSLGIGADDRARMTLDEVEAHEAKLEALASRIGAHFVAGDEFARGLVCAEADDAEVRCRWGHPGSPMSLLVDPEPPDEATVRVRVSLTVVVGALMVGGRGHAEGYGYNALVDVRRTPEGELAAEVLPGGLRTILQIPIP